jgi:uncharacterized protein (UPF0548 family)
VNPSDLPTRPVTYAAVGATRSPDLLAFPPIGYRPMTRRARIGHGDERFEWASTETMTWGIQRRTGFTVRRSDLVGAAEGAPYAPVVYDDSGVPVGAAPAAERGFGPDGSPFLVAGETAVLGLPFGIRSPVRVVYVIDEPSRRGFAYGTLPGHPQDGEEAFVVEQGADGSVWLTVTAFSRPSNRFWRAVSPALRVAQELITRRYVRSLAGRMA